MSSPRKDASIHTINKNLELYNKLDWKNTADFNSAKAGFQTPNIPPPIIYKGKREIWNAAQYTLDGEFEDKDWNPSIPVNPSLWRVSQLNNHCGLFNVCPGIYQVRGYDMSNMTIIEPPGTKGLIIIDPLISEECAAAALQLYQGNVQGANDRKVTTVIYTHSHIDHFGGVGGILPGYQDDMNTKGYYDPTDPNHTVEIIAPNGFLEHAASENVYAGTAMGRRAQYMYGPFLQVGEKGQVDAGLGKNQSTGTYSLVAPTVNIDVGQQDGETFKYTTVDGVTLFFQPTPGTEAPSEFNFLVLPHNALCMAENATHNLHNILTLRGAQVRDSLAWSKYLQRTIALFFDQNPSPYDFPADTPPPPVIFAQHHWPTFDQLSAYPDAATNIKRYLKSQRDMYRYLNDQTLRLINRGYTGIQIAEMLELPPNLDKQWYNRGYYGSMSHNVKAVYQRYMGWFDGNPCNLHSLPPEQAAKKYFAYMGGLEAILPRAVNDYEDGQYRWVSEVLKHVMALPESYQEQLDSKLLKKARLLLADSLEQQGYQAEAATWRNFYLMGAQELRYGITKVPASPGAFLSALETEMCFDALAVMISPGKFGYIQKQEQKKNNTEHYSLELRFRFDYPTKPLHEFVQVTVENCALSYLQYPKHTFKGKEVPLIEMARSDFNLFLTQLISHPMQSGDASQTLEDKVKASIQWIQSIVDDLFSVNPPKATVKPADQLATAKANLTQFFALLGSTDPNFPIVTPKVPKPLAVDD